MNASQLVFEESPVNVAIVGSCGLLLRCFPFPVCFRVFLLSLESLDVELSSLLSLLLLYVCLMRCHFLRECLLSGDADESTEESVVLGILSLFVFLLFRFTF